MNPVFRGDLVNIRSGTSIRLALPAEPYKILDGMECVHCGNPSNVRYEIGVYEKAGYLSGILGDAAEGEDIQRLNCLAGRLRELDALQETAFCGMAEKETQSQGKISLERLVDLSYSTESCHVLPEVRSDFQLGEFLVDNGFVAEFGGHPGGDQEVPGLWENRTGAPGGGRGYPDKVRICGAVGRNSQHQRRDGFPLYKAGIHYFIGDKGGAYLPANG